MTFLPASSPPWHQSALASTSSRAGGASASHELQGTGTGGGRDRRGREGREGEEWREEERVLEATCNEVSV